MVIQQGVWEKPKALEIPQKQIEWPKVLEMVPIVKNMLAVYHRLLRVIHREGNSHKEIKFKNQKRYHHRIHQFPRQSDQPRQLLLHLRQGRKEYFYLYLCKVLCKRRYGNQFCYVSHVCSAVFRVHQEALVTRIPPNMDHLQILLR